MKKFLLLSLVVFQWLSGEAADVGCFDAFYSQPSGIGVWGWVVIVVAAVALGVWIYFSGGGGLATAPAWIKAVGTWVGGTVYGLHGAVAMKAGLALLGGGSIAAGGLGVKGGIVLLTVLASTSTEIALEYSANEAIGYFSNRAFIEDSKKMSTLPLPINDKGSDAYVQNLKWIQSEKKRRFDDKGLEFNITESEFQNVLREASLIFGRDMLSTTDEDDRIKDLTYLSILHFQRSSYRESCKYARDAIVLAVNSGESASLAKCVYSISYLYSESASGNLDVQKKHLVPAILEEGDNKFTPFVITVYLDRLMYRIHNGASSAKEMEFVLDLLSDERFEDNAMKCLPIFTVRLILEIKRCQKDIEVLSKCTNTDFLRKNNVEHVLDVRLGNFNALRVILGGVMPHVKKHEKNFDKEYPFTHDNLSKQILGFKTLESDLSTMVADVKRRLVSAPIQQDRDWHWWNPLSWIDDD